MNNIIDLRSDTVTRPSKEMREAMFNAEVGDDVFGEDPTVNKLQELVSATLGKESALYVPSGTMSNQLAVKSHTEIGDEIICEGAAHIFQYETAGPSVISNVQVYPIPGKYGMMKLQEIEDSIRPDIYYFPKTKLICLENTHNRAGGTIIDFEYIKNVNVLATAHDLNMHLDGARLWNASIATGINVAEYAKYFDTVSVCLSKGLGAPVGSVLCGSKELITKAKKFRKILGGGMRQAGILAAAGIYAIQNNFNRLAEDHKRAKYLADVLSNISVVDLDMESVQTNIIIFGFKDPKVNVENLISKFIENNLLVSRGTKGKIRLVTHLDVDDLKIEKASEILKHILNN